MVTLHERFLAVPLRPAGAFEQEKAGLAAPLRGTLQLILTGAEARNSEEPRMATDTGLGGPAQRRAVSGMDFAAGDAVRVSGSR